MINALYIVKFADGVSVEQKTAMADAARKRFRGGYLRGRAR